MELNIEEILGKVMNDRKFIESTFENKEGQILFSKIFRVAIIEKLATVLNYYLISDDNTTDYTFDDILKKYQNLIAGIDENKLKQIIESGYFTHSFNGSEKKYIEKYGFDYISKLNDEELKELNEMRKRLDYLSKKYGENYYIEEARFLRWKRNIDEPSSEEFFFCTPGRDSIQYALEQSPERLFNGILRKNREPMIVEESKKNYLIRCLKKKVNPEDYAIVEQVINDYCSDSTYIALLDYEKMKNIPTSVTVFDKNSSHSVEEIVERLEPMGVSDYFPTRAQRPSMEFLKKHGSSYLSNMVTLVEFIPKAEYPMIRMPDIYEIMQMYAREKGLQAGQLFDCKTGDFIRNPNLTEIKSLMEQMEEEQSSKWTIDERSQTDLQKLEEMVNNYNFGDSADAPEL